MSVFKLTRPINVNGSPVNELTYDLEGFSAQDKINTGKECKKAGIMTTVQELDSDYHMYLFATAVVKSNPDMTIMDILRMSAKDATRAESVIRDFFFLNSEDTSPTSISILQ